MRHRITIVGTKNEYSDMKKVLPQSARYSSEFEAKHVLAPLTPESFPLHMNHVILFTPTGIDSLTQDCATVVRQVSPRGRSPG